MKCKLNPTKGFALLILCLFTGSGLWAQSKTVQGTVTDANGPVIGVSVTVQGTTTGVSTGGNGSFSIRVPNNEAVLEFNFLGYKTITMPVGDRTTIDVVLQEDTQVIEDIVVVGYGTMRRRDLTGSVASVGGEEIAAMPVANVAQALQGKIAGVTITSQDGRPDAGIKIRVRGGGSVTQSNDPLYVVDGFPVDNINDIPSGQIESITILKDASSTAIYGARGANGVVLVTTKTPEKNRLTVSYDMYYSVKTLPGTESVLGGSDYVMFNWELFELHPQYRAAAFERAYALGAPGTEAFKSSVAQYDALTTNWMDKIYGTPTGAWSHNISVSGGNQKTNFSLSYNSLKDDALRIESSLKRQTVMAKLNQELTKGVRLSFDTRFNQAEIYGQNSSTNAATFYVPVVPLGDINESTNPDFNMNADQVNPLYNPEVRIRDSYDLRTRNGVQINAALAWDILPGLTFKTEYGVQYRWQKNYSFSGPIAMRGNEYGLNASIDRNEIFDMRFVNTLNYQVKGLGEQHRLDLLAGQETNGWEREESRMSAQGLPWTFDKDKAFGAISKWSNSHANIISNTYESPEKLYSYFGRVNYAFKDRYLLTASFRADGSGKFAPDSRWGYFPAAALAWRMNEENFLKNATWIDNLKLRVSYGEVGNNRIASDLWRIAYESKTGGYAFGDVRQSYYSDASGDLMYNEELRWETTVTRNLGLDFGLLKNRIYGTIEGYWNTTKGLLLIQTIPTYWGYRQQLRNQGQTRNVGIEFTLGGDIIRQKDFVLSANFNISHNQSRIEDLGPGMDILQAASGWGSTTITPYSDYLYQVGKPIGLIQGYVYDGFYTTNDFNYNPANQVYTLKPGVTNSASISSLPGNVATGQLDTYSYPGSLKLKKISDSNPESISTEDVTVIGDTNPKHIGGFNLNAVYKGFDAMLSFNWSYGNDIYNANRVRMSSMEQNTVNRNMIGEMANRYRLFDDQGNRVHTPSELDALNQNATIFYGYNLNKVVSSWAVEDGSFLRLNNVTVGYTLPQELTRKISISRLRVYATVYNVYTWTNYSGLDPEVDSRMQNSSMTPGLDYDAYPRARTFTFGLNLTF